MGTRPGFRYFDPSRSLGAPPGVHRVMQQPFVQGRPKGDRRIWCRVGFASITTLALAMLVWPSAFDVMRWGGPQTSGWIAIGIGAAVAAHALRHRRFGLPEAPWWPAVAVGLGGLGVVAARQVLEIPLLAALCGGVALYGGLGFWLPSAGWRSLWAPAIMLVGALPVGQRADEWFGLPARLWAAEWAYGVLARAGVGVDSAQTVLVFENGLTEVAAACAGLRGMWTATILLAFVAAIERRRMGIRLLLVVVGTYLGLIATNAVRILALIWLAMVLDMRPLAALIHEPLGLTAFVGVLGLAIAAIRAWVPARPARADSSKVETLGVARPEGRPSVYAYAVGSVSAVAAAAFISGAPVRAVPPAPPVVLPTGMQTAPAALVPAERALARSFAGGRIEKVRFDHGGVQGQLIMLQAKTWRAQHPPELCLRMAGHRLTGAYEQDVGPAHRVRVLEIDEGRRLAAYWYQSRRTASPDLWTKVWSTWSGRDTDWVLVSFLFDAGDSSAVLSTDTLAVVHRAVDRVVSGGRGARDGARADRGVGSAPNTAGGLHE